MDKRYQVFVSSTYEDLKEERKEVMQALLELDCIPAGMELFQASNDDQWSVIKRVIDDCDYYVLIVGGRYGSIGPSGIGYVEMEYRYAIEQEKPVITFLYKDIGQLQASRVETSDEGKRRLQSFRDMVKSRLCRYWSSKEELGRVVISSMIRLIKDIPAIGWIRADTWDPNASNKLLKYQERIDELEKEISRSMPMISDQMDDFAQGGDKLVLKYTLVIHYADFADQYDVPLPDEEFETTWDNVIRISLPYMLNWRIDHELRRRIEDFVFNNVRDYYTERLPNKTSSLYRCNLLDSEYEKIIIQLKALDLIEVNMEMDAAKPWNAAVYWRITRNGDRYLTRMLAAKRS